MRLTGEAPRTPGEISGKENAKKRRKTLLQRYLAQKVHVCTCTYRTSPYLSRGTVDHYLPANRPFGLQHSAAVPSFERLVVYLGRCANAEAASAGCTAVSSFSQMGTILEIFQCVFHDGVRDGPGGAAVQLGAEKRKSRMPSEAWGANRQRKPRLSGRERVLIDLDFPL